MTNQTNNNAGMSAMEYVRIVGGVSPTSEAGKTMLNLIADGSMPMNRAKYDAAKGKADTVPASASASASAIARPPARQAGLTKANLADLSELQALRAENERLKAQKAAKSVFTLRVSEKGAVSVYGLGRFPMTLYREQWERVLAHADQIKAFISANADSLKVKD